MGNTNLKVIREVALHHKVKLPAFAAALKSLRNVTVLGTPTGGPVTGKVEDMEDKELQDWIRKALPEVVGMVPMLVQRREIAVKVVLRFSSISREIGIDELPGKMEVSASLRDGNAADTETKTHELQFRVVDIHYFEAKTASEREEVGMVDLRQSA